MARIHPAVPRAAAALALAIAFAAPAPGQTAGAPEASDPPQAGGAVSVPEDLFAVITLRGKPCGAVERYERVGESDYRVDCSDGHRYRVRVTAGGRVVVEER